MRERLVFFVQRVLSVWHSAPGTAFLLVEFFMALRATPKQCTAAFFVGSDEIPIGQVGALFQRLETRPLTTSSLQQN
jgi:hypothetical protein